MDQQTIMTLVVGALVAIASFVYRYYQPLDPVKSWFEMGLSIVGSIVIALVLGKVTWFTDWSNPLATIQHFLESATIVFGIVQFVFSALKQALPQNAMVIKVLGA